jgi:predicted esterase
MSELEQLEQRVKLLSRQDLAAFREWFLEYDERLWDQQIADDADAGRLDAFVKEARTEYEQGKTRDL